jgi:hypothetical protein
MSTTNLTLTLDRDVLRRARVRAVLEGTSVNAIVREHLERYAGADPAADGLRRFLELAAQSQAGSGPGGRRWSRAEIYDRVEPRG